MALTRGYSQKANTSTKRSFESWWATVPKDLRQKARNEMKETNHC